MMITPTEDVDDVDVRDEVDDVEREPTSAEDDDHGHAQSIVLPLPLILGFFFGRGLPPSAGPRIHPLCQASHNEPDGEEKSKS